MNGFTRLRYIILSALTLMFVFPGFLKASGTDSLRTLLSKEKNITNKINLYVKLAYSVNSYDSAFFYLDEGLRLSEKEKSGYGFAFLYVTMSRIAGGLGEYEKAIVWGRKGVEAGIKINNDSLTARAFISIGFMQFTMSNYDKAVESYINCLKFAERSGDLRTTAGAYSELGLTLATKKPVDHKKALNYLFKAEEINRKIKSFRSLGFVYIRIGAIYVNKKEPERAKVYLDKAMHIGDSINDVSVQKWTIETYGGMYKQLKDYKNALPLYLKALAISRREKEWPGIVSSSASVADMYTKLDDTKRAMMYVDSAIDGALQYKIYSSLYHCYKCKSSIYEKDGDYKSSLNYYKKCVNIRDSLFKTENSENLNELEKKYETEKKEKELTEKSSELLLQKADNEKQQAQRNGFIIGTVLLLILLIFIFRGSRQKQKANVLIAMQKKEVEEQKYIIEEKQKEVMDSINYAKKIQTAHLPNEKYIEKKMSELKRN